MDVVDSVWRQTEIYSLAHRSVAFRAFLAEHRQNRSPGGLGARAWPGIRRNPRPRVTSDCTPSPSQARRAAYRASPQGRTSSRRHHRRKESRPMSLIRGVSSVSLEPTRTPLLFGQPPAQKTPPTLASRDRLAAIALRTLLEE